MFQRHPGRHCHTRGRSYAAADVSTVYLEVRAQGSVVEIMCHLGEEHLVAIGKQGGQEACHLETSWLCLNVNISTSGLFW